MYCIPVSMDHIHNIRNVYIQTNLIDSAAGDSNVAGLEPSESLLNAKKL